MRRKHILPMVIGCILLAVFLLMSCFPGLFTQYGQKEIPCRMTIRRKSGRGRKTGGFAKYQKSRPEKCKNA